MKRLLSFLAICLLLSSCGKKGMSDEALLKSKSWKKISYSDVNTRGYELTDKPLYIEGIIYKVSPAVLKQNKGLLNLWVIPKYPWVEATDEYIFISIKENVYPLNTFAGLVKKRAKVGFWGRIKLGGLTETGAKGSQKQQPSFEVLRLKMVGKK